MGAFQHGAWETYTETSQLAEIARFPSPRQEKSSRGTLSTTHTPAQSRVPFKKPFTENMKQAT